MEINVKIENHEDRMIKEFTYIKEYIKDVGIDVGCGTNRLSSDVLAIDAYDYKNSDCHTDKQKALANDIVHDCKDLECEPCEFNGNKYTFEDGSLDFIFSSHCLEDFENIKPVFLNWWKKLKPNGFMILLLPDMENGRYPKVEEGGNPSHRTNVGRNYILNMLKQCDNIIYEVVQCDTIPHNKSCTIDFVIRKGAY